VLISQRFAVLGAALPLAGFVSYIWAMTRGRAEPNRVSWALWASAPLIAFAAEIMQGTNMQIALVTFTLGLGPLLVLLVSFANRGCYWKLARLDIVCGGLSGAAVAAWVMTGRGDAAIALSIAADTFAALPTVLKSYARPESESPWTYLASGAGAVITLLTVRHWASATFASYAFPSYVAAICALISALILFPRPARRAGARAVPDRMRGRYRPEPDLITALAPADGGSSPLGLALLTGLAPRREAEAGSLTERPLPESVSAARPQPLPFPMFAAPVAEDLEAPEFEAHQAEAPDVTDGGAPGCRGVAFVAHCLLNQNSRAGEGAYCAGISAPVVEALRVQGWRIEQMPCPELAFAGLSRWWMVREQLDTVGYRRHCRKLADTIAARIAVHTRQGRPVVLIGVDGSPSMGVHVTLSDPACGGRPVGSKANVDLIPGEGILIEELRWALTLLGLGFPPADAETHDLPGHDVAVQRIQLESLLASESQRVEQHQDERGHGQQAVAIDQDHREVPLGRGIADRGEGRGWGPG
jgi:predicted secreted protein